MQRNGVVYVERYMAGIWHKALITLCITSMVAGLAACAPKPQPPQSDKPGDGQTAVPTLTPAPAPESLLDFYPLKTGNMWEYEGEGMEFASFVQSVVFSSGSKYQLNIDNGGTVVANVIQVREDSITNTYRGGEQYTGENLLDKKDNVNIILLQTPLEKGSFWISEENHYEIVDTDAAVKVPAGEFEGCIAVKVTFKDQSSNMIFIYKKGVGLVQSEFRTDEGDLIISRLKRYELK
jgi:hypothetical protein